MFRKGVASEVRLREKAYSGNAASLRKLVPLRLANRMQLEIGNQQREQALQYGHIGKGRRNTPLCFD
jgi:hypothetical protein